MPAPYSVDIRTRLLNWYNAGNGSLDEAADVFTVGVATASRWVARFKSTGEIAAHAPGGGNEPLLTSEDLEEVRAIVTESPALTIVEIAERLVERGGTRVSRSTMSRAVAKSGFTLKKTRRSTKRLSRRA